MYGLFLLQAHSKKVHEVELLCSDLRAETERLEAQGKAYKERIAGLEDRLREATERAENATSSSYLQPELRDLEQQCAQGLQCFIQGPQDPPPPPWIFAILVYNVQCNI